MRVALDGTPLIGNKTGVGWYTYELVDALAERAPDDNFVLFPISWRTARVVDAPDRPNVSVERRFAPARQLWWAWKTLRRPAIESFVECDVFHATNFVGPPSKRVPLVVTVHDLWFVHDPAGCPPAVRAMARMLPGVLDRAAGVIVPSAFVADEVANWHPSVADRITTVHHGYRRRAPARAGAAPGDPYVLWLGTVTRRKNIELLLGALARLRGEGRPVRAVIAGVTDGTVDLRSLLATYEVGDVVDVRGYVDEATAAALLRDAAAFVFPSRYEGFGLPLLEAMDAGVPIVAADAGASREIAGDAALFTAPDDVDGFADALAAVVTDPGQHAELVGRGSARLDAFSWADAAAATAAVYERVT
jgi:glycosyltransferase involved in cell wall biosynthesis